ncbi:MAG: hypothetical protein ABIK92_06605 [Pseudomonadota bacterium]
MTLQNIDSIKEGKKFEKLQEVLSESLRFSVYPKELIDRFGILSLDTMKALSISGYYIPLFASIDIFCSFFSPSLQYYQSINPLPVKHLNFSKFYCESYIRFLKAIRDIPALQKMANLFYFEKYRYKNKNSASELYFDNNLFYETFVFIIRDMAMVCPLTNIQQVYDPSIISIITWDDLYIPSRKKFALEEEINILKRLGFDNFIPSPFSGNHSWGKKIDILLKSFFLVSQNQNTKYNQPIHHINDLAKEKKTQKVELLNRNKKIIKDISKTSYLFDYKLIDLYILNVDDFNPSDKLRRKIAQLQNISRQAIEKSPFNTEYTDPKDSGVINTFYLSMDDDLFKLKYLEKQPIFFGNQPPIKEQENLGVRFCMLEDIKSISEKICEKNRYRYPHITVHKLISILLCSDIIKYLGKVPELNIIMDLIIYTLYFDSEKESSTKKVRLSMKDLINSRKEVDLTNLKELQEKLFLEAPLLKTYSFVPNINNYNILFNSINDSDDSLMRMSGCNRVLNLFFGWGGLYLQENALNNSQQEKKNKHDEVNKNENEEEYNLSTNIRDIRANSQNISLYSPNTYVIETNCKYLLTSGHGLNRTVFKTQIKDDKLSKFLNNTREYFLNILVDEAIERKCS